jgi:acyl-CoA thioester hydrolase
MHVNNVEYVKWLQEVSRAHWEQEVSKDILDNYFWVVRTHHIDYKKEAFEGDVIEAKTYVQGYKGPFSERVVEFKIADFLLVKAVSTWCLIDKKTLKPSRVPEFIKECF